MRNNGQLFVYQSRAALDREGYPNTPIMGR